MNQKGTRNTNGEGGTYSVVEKHKRKKFLKEECIICKNCTDRTACNNRLGYDKCKKCEDCKIECLKYCDRFYCYAKFQSQITIDGKQTTVANENKKKDCIEKKKDVEADLKTNNYIKKTNLTLLEIIKSADKQKYNIKNVSKATQNRDEGLYNNLDNLLTFTNMPIQKLSVDLINDELDNLAFYSQSQIEKIVQKIKFGIYEAAESNYTSLKKLPISKIKMPISEKEKREVIAFDIDEQQQLIKYVCTTKTLIGNSKSTYDNITIKNLILLALFSLARIGELGALDLKEHIDFKNNNIIIERSLTEDEHERKVIGNSTKTGKKLLSQGLKDKRYIPFALFDKEIVTHILNQQISHSKNNLNNKNNLLFCRKTGELINPKQITPIFKRICRDAGIKLELPKGCHIHMTRHTGVTRLVEFGMDSFTIISFTGHTTTREIEKTYAHILENYRNKKLEDPQFHYKKTDLITSEIKELILKS